MAYGQLEFGKEEFIGYLGRFNLFAFILHDRESHPEFDAYLNQSFLIGLDRSTGEMFLFFTLVNPAEVAERREQLIVSSASKKV
ncbi:MAG: hypothetical protein IPG02_14010 [Ignavibacteria bacterium]|nr:hypothetical protein [Ignavibacteria bacterium]